MSAVSANSLAAVRGAQPSRSSSWGQSVWTRVCRSPSRALTRWVRVWMSSTCSPARRVSRVACCWSSRTRIRARLAGRGRVRAGMWKSGSRLCRDQRSRLISPVRWAMRWSRWSMSSFRSREAGSWPATGRSGRPARRGPPRARRWVGLAAGAGGASVDHGELGWDANDAFAGGQQDPFEAAGDVPAVLDGPHPLVPVAAPGRARPAKQLGAALVVGPHGALAELASDLVDRHGRVGVLVHVDPEDHHQAVSLGSCHGRPAGGQFISWGTGHAPIRPRWLAMTGWWTARRTAATRMRGP